MHPNSIFVLGSLLLGYSLVRADEFEAVQPNSLNKSDETLLDVDREAISGQDPRCAQFVYSTLVPEDVQTSDHGATMLTNIFGLSNIQKKSREYRFNTPNYPEHFPDDIECIKIIAAPSKDQRILLTFRGLFEIEPESRCMVEFLEIRDGAFGFSPLFGRYCGRGLPNIGTGLKSSGPYMWLRFRSDSTIPHRGFQAVFRFFQTHPVTTPGDVYRIRHRMDLSPGTMYNLDESFLLERLRAVQMPVPQRLPIEAVFDIRVPTDNFLMVHVINITVPRDFAWSCSPSEHLDWNTVPRCRADSSALTGIKVTSKEFEVPDIEIDPASIIDGRETVFEVYPRNTISAYSPPCPKIRRFCDTSAGVPQAPDKEGEADRDFFIRGSRVVIRIVMASPSRSPERRARHTGMETTFTVQKGKRKRRQDTPIFNLEQMPVFHFQITALKKAFRNVNDGTQFCEESWRACDGETCIPETFWCDKIRNCPRWQDEGLHCDYMIEQVHRGYGKSPMELRKEQEKRELEAEHLAAQKLHLSILASLGFALIIITTSCVLMTLRRRHVEKRRQSLKPQNIQHLQSRESNHNQNSASENKPKTNRYKIFKSQSGGRRKSTKQKQVVWNSKENAKAPLLRQLTEQNLQPKQTEIWRNDSPNELQISNENHTVSGLSQRPGTEQETPGRLEQPQAYPSFSISVRQLNSTGYNPRRTLEQSPQYNKESRAVASPRVMERTPQDSRPIDMLWTVGQASPIRMAVTSRSRSSLFDPKTKVTPVSTAERHVASCRLINRTQSWGGGLRLAGVHSFHTNGTWEITSPHNGDELAGEPSPTAIATDKMQTYVYPVQQFNDTHEQTTCMSMPDMKDAVHNNHSSLSRDCKPPVAKRPRIANASVPGMWVASNYAVQADESSDTEIIDEYGSILSGAGMPELQTDAIGLSATEHTYGMWSRHPMNEYTTTDSTDSQSETPQHGQIISHGETSLESDIDSTSANSSADQACAPPDAYARRHRQPIVWEQAGQPQTRAPCVYEYEA